MRWIDNADSWVCSRCRFESHYLKPNCPNCKDVAKNVEINVEMPSKELKAGVKND